MSRETPGTPVIAGEALEEIADLQFRDSPYAMMARWRLNKNWAADGRDLHQELVEQLHLRGDETVLDIGFGDGRVLSEHIHDQGHEGQLIGVDSKLGVLSFAKFLIRNRGGFVPPLLVADGRSLSFFPDNMTDVGIAAFVLYYLDEDGQGAMLQELRRLIRPGGKLVVATNDRGHKPQVYKFKAAVAKGLGVPIPPEAPHSCPPETAKALLQSTGFEVVDESTQSSYLNIDCEAACSAYLDAFDTYRSDFKPYPGSNWEGPRWLDVVNEYVREPIMEAIRTKGRFIDPLERTTLIAINEK